ncbi:hypothetical protein ACHAWC_008900 [Mediolabrus comicus]
MEIELREEFVFRKFFARSSQKVVEYIFTIKKFLKSREKTVRLACNSTLLSKTAPRVTER